MNEKELTEYVTAYEAWWSASEYYNFLVEKCLEGDKEALDQAKAASQHLDELHQIYIKKKLELKDTHH